MLTIVVIVGVLGVISLVVIPMPSGHSVYLRSGNQLRNIVTAYLYAKESGRLNTDSVRSVSDFALRLTEAAPQINESRLWFIAEDDRLDRVEIPRGPVFSKNDGTPVLNPAFLSVAPKSYAIALPAQIKDEAPLGWTRGLRGTTWAKDSPWRGEGGHIAFGNGSVAWVNDTLGDDEKGIFVDAVSKRQTADIRAALGSGTLILEDR